MKKSEFIKRLYTSIDSMFNGVSDKTLIGSMFSKNKSLKFTKNDFKDFLSSPYLNNFEKIFDSFFTSQGNKIDKDKFFEQASIELLEYFNKNNLTKDKTFLESFPYESISDPAYFKNIATIIVNVLSHYGKPPLFHKTQDKVVKYDWEPEKLSLFELKDKLDKNKKLKGIFESYVNKGHPCLKANKKALITMNKEELESLVYKFLSKIDGYWPVIDKNKFLITDE